MEFALAEVGGTTGRGLASQRTKDQDQLGSIAIELIDADLRPYSSFAFLGDLQEDVKRHPLLETLSFRGHRSGPGGDSLDVQFYGADPQTLKDAAEALKTAVTQFPEVSAVEDNLAYDKEELILELTPQGQALGFTIDGIGKELRNRLNGIKAASFPVGVRTGEITVRLPEKELTADFLDRTRLRTLTGEYVPLADVVSVTTKLGFSTVRRENGLRLISVTGDISEDDPRRAEYVVTQLSEEILPTIASDFSVEWRLAGLSEQEDEFLSDALVSLMFCLLGIYLTLAWIFSSWTRPAVVMGVIPFGLVGAIWGHYVWEVPMSMFSVVGLIGMVGIIINDSIVLVSTIDEYSQNRGVVPAIIDGAADRLRPVLLTTLTTILGLAPLLYESSQQAQFLKPTVITLVYGLGFGLVLVLLVVPSLMAVQLDISRLMQSYRRGVLGPRMGTAHRLVLILSSLIAVALVVLTTGYLSLTGRLWAPLETLAQKWAGVPETAVAVAVLLMGLILVALVALGASAVLMRKTKQ